MKSSNYYGIGNDEYKFYKTIDNGKTWTTVGEGNGPLMIKDNRMIISGGFSDDNLTTIQDGKVGELIGKDDKYIYIKVEKKQILGEDGKNFSPPNDYIGTGGSNIGSPSISEDEYYGEDDLINGNSPDGIYRSEDGEKWERIGPIERGFPEAKDPLLYLLNDIIIYNLTNMLANEHDLKKLNYSNYKGPETFFTNSQIYKTSIEGIDYVVDVGMRPFSVNDLEEYQNLKEAEEELKNEFFEDPTELKIERMLKENQSLKKSFQIIDLKLNNLKKLMQKKSIKDIESMKEKYDGVSEEDIEVMKGFYEVRKLTEESIVGTIINSIFTFNNSKKMALLKMSIVESARLMKETLNAKISFLKEKYNKNITSEDIIGIEEIRKMFKFNLKKIWGDGLKSSIEKYYIESIKNIYSITENEDKNLIHIASEEYNENRIDLLSKASTKLDYLGHIDINLSDLKDKLNKCSSDYFNNVKSLTEAKEILDQFEEYKKQNNDIISMCFKTFDKLSKEYQVKFIDSLNNIEVNYFSINDYEEELINMPFDTSDRVYNYYDQIIDKFKKRCVELYNMVGLETINKYIIPYINLENLVYNWTNDFIKSKDKEKFVIDNNIPIINNELNDMANDFDNIVKKSWNGAKELI